MRVVLIAPPIMDRVDGALRPIAMDAARECPPYGIYLLATVLRQAGHEATVVDLIAEASKDIGPFHDAVAAADLIGVGATSLSWPTASDVVTQIRALRPDVPIVLGGIHPTMFDRYLLDAFPVDYIVRGEGEIALPLLVEAVEGKRELATVPNLSWRDGERRVVRNPVARKLTGAEIAAFPAPDFGALPPGVYKAISIESSRGCAFDCAFCSTSYRRSWRALPVDAFLDRLEQTIPAVTILGAHGIHIVDDEFSTDPRRAMKIAGAIGARGLDVKLVYDSRARDLLWDGYVESMAGLTSQFLVGAECGYDEGLARVGKGANCAVLEAAARKLYEHDLSEQADFSFILGLPWETRSEVEKTIRFAVHLFGEYGVRILLQWYCEIPGSRLWDEDYRNGLVTPAMYDDYGFFQNLYLTRLALRNVSPADIYQVAEMIGQLKFVAKLQYGERRMIESAVPDAISLYFPPYALPNETDGLPSLREVAQSGRTTERTECAAVM
jgi:anaerobic magnesium-protoporphyrin IX monomethyl ester cyclase